jgi:general stress protein CsbA
MATIWIVFIGAAILLAAGGYAAAREKGSHGPVFHRIALFLFLMATGTAVFPSLLAVLGPIVWTGAYIAFVVTITVVMTRSAVLKARRLAAAESQTIGLGTAGMQ